MAHNNMKSFEYAKEIVVAKMSSSTISPCEINGNDAAAFFEAIFNKLVELENKAHALKND